MQGSLPSQKQILVGARSPIVGNFIAIPYLFVYLTSFMLFDWRPEINQGTAPPQKCLFAARPNSQKSFSTDFPVLRLIHHGISFLFDQDGPTTPNFPTENTSPTAPALDSHLSSHNTKTQGKFQKFPISPVSLKTHLSEVRAPIPHNISGIWMLLQVLPKGVSQLPTDQTKAVRKKIKRQ